MPTIVTRALVQRLAAETAGDAPPASETTPASGDAELAAARLLAAAVRGAPPTVDELRTVLPNVGQSLWGPLVGAASGDRVAMLLDLVELDRMSDEREAMALLLAAELSGKTPPARLRAELRKRLRREVSTEATVAQLAAAETLRDADVTELAKGLYVYVPIGAPKALASAVRQELRGPVLDVLPERAPPAVVSGFTARRVAPKIGRNDPCPCGSGKKYKKCCEGKDAERAADPSPVPGMTRTEWLAKGGATMSELDVDGLRADELALLDPEALATGPLLVAMRRLLAFHRWPEAERALAVLAARTDLKPGVNGDRYRQEVLIEALREGEREVAQRVLDAIEDHDDLLPDVRLSLAILDPSEDTLAELEDAALAGLEDPAGEEGVGLAYALLDHAPALGILVARGVLATERGHDAYELLDELEHARDRLCLPPGDPAGAQFDEYVSQSVRAQKEREALAGAQAERDRLMAEADELRRQVQRSNANVNELVTKLREEEARLAASKKEEETKDDGARASAPSPAELEARRRLEQKVAEMKALISEGNRERAELRKKLTTTAESIDRATVPATLAPAPEPAEEEDPGRAVSQPRGLHVPAFAASAQASLRKLPARVGKDALLAAASLGAGEVEGWHTVKQMQDIEPPLFSCRLGIHHRMLFRVGDGVLDVLEVLPREALDATLKRYR